LKTETLSIKVTADLSDFPVLVKTAEYEAYKEAVEVLEGAAGIEEVLWLRKYNRTLSTIINEQTARVDRAERAQYEQSSECRRLAAQVEDLRTRLKNTSDESNRLSNELFRMRGIQADATGAEILALVREGYGVRFEPGDFPRNIPAKVTVEKRVDEMRHANSGALDTGEHSNAVPAVEALAYALKKVAYQLKRAIRPSFATGGVIEANTYADWMRRRGF